MVDLPGFKAKKEVIENKIREIKYGSNIPSIFIKEEENLRYRDAKTVVIENNEVYTIAFSKVTIQSSL